MVRDRNPFHCPSKHPHLTVLVEVVRNVCCLAIIPDYNKYKKYNLLELGMAMQKGHQKENDPDDTKETNQDISACSAEFAVVNSKIDTTDERSDEVNKNN